MVDESDLVSLAQQGSSAAWEDLTRLHQQNVFRLAYLLLGDADDAEDVAQETFIRAYGALNSFDSSRALRPWLLRITANQARNYRRAAGRYMSHLLRFARHQPAFTPSLEFHEYDDLWHAIRRLKKEFQDVIFLRYFLELPETEMAEALSVPPGTVKSRLNRALTALRQAIERDANFQKDKMV